MKQKNPASALPSSIGLVGSFPCRTGTSPLNCAAPQEPLRPAGHGEAGEVWSDVPHVDTGVEVAGDCAAASLPLEQPQLDPVPSLPAALTSLLPAARFSS